MIKMNIGDVLIFEAKEDFISKVIAFITDSKYSHAAMVYDKNCIVEMGLSGIGVSSIVEGKDDTALLLRLEPNKDTKPLHDAAEKYVLAETLYDFPALLIIGGLLIYKKIHPTDRLISIMDIIIRQACVLLDNLIQKLIFHNPDKAMVCSQLVYQVYEDCGKDYRINITNPQVRGSEKLSANDDGTVRLIDIAKDAEVFTGNLMLQNDVEKMAKELYSALREQTHAKLAVVANNDLAHISSVTKRFVDLLEKFIEKANLNIPINSLFVTPEDLAHNTANLKELGTLNISRLK